MPRPIISTADDILTLSRFAFEIRTPLSSLDTEETEAMTSMVEDAVDAVRLDSNIPLLPEYASVLISSRITDYIVYSDDPFALGFVKSRHPFTYSETRRQAMAGLFNNNLVTTPTNEPINDDARLGLLSASLDSPKPANASVVRLEYRRGLFEGDARIGDIRSMVILRARAIFDGTVSVPDKSRSAYERLLDRVRFEGLLPQSFERIGLA